MFSNFLYTEADDSDKLTLIKENILLTAKDLKDKYLVFKFTQLSENIRAEELPSFKHGSFDIYYAADIIEHVGSEASKFWTQKQLWFLPVSALITNGYKNNFPPEPCTRSSALKRLWKSRWSTPKIFSCIASVSALIKSKILVL